MEYMYTQTLIKSKHGNFAVNIIVADGKPAWVYVTCADWKRTGIRITIPTDSTEPRLDIDAMKALSVSDGAERIIEANRFLPIVRACAEVR